MSALSTEVHELLLARGQTVATAESLTAGLLGAALTATPGSSSTYRGGVIVYATDLKATLAGVSLALLEKRGAVDPDVAVALATGARDRLAATWGLGVTGVAGPDRQDGQPVGTVFVAVVGPHGEPRTAAAVLSGDREAVRSSAVDLAMRLLRDRLADAE